MKNNSKTKIIGITTGSYPYGTATSTRNMLLFKGLKELGHNVKLYSIYPDKNQDKESNKISGVFEGVAFKYTVKNLVFGENRMFRALKMLISAIRCLKIILNEAKQREIIVFNFINTPLITYLITKKLKRKNIKVLHETTEFPFNRKNQNFVTNYLYYKLTIPLFDKIFVISTALRTHFLEYVKQEKIEILNMIVDVNRFNENNNDKSKFEFEYIAYCGSMNTNKDGVPMLIEAFSKVEKNYPELKLVLIGDIKNKAIQPEITNTINKYSLNEKVVFTGQINNVELPHYLSEAKILALARPNNIQAKGGFPTKLGEYLATGKPVVITNVGDIPLFITDGINAYLSEPNANMFSEKILEVLNDYQFAEKVGKNGYSLAKKKFSYKSEILKIDTTIKLFKSIL